MPDENADGHRFNDKAGTDYDLFRLACPHYDEIEDELRKILRRSFKNSSLGEIAVLEIGTGHGYTTKRLILSDERVRVTSVDNELGMAEQAKKNLREYALAGRVDIIIEDALDFLKRTPSASFDMVASALTIHNFERGYRHKALKEMHRVLRERGVFANADKYARDSLNHEKDLQWQLEQFGVFESIGRPDLRLAWAKHYEEDERTDRIMGEGESINELKSIGFIEITISCRRYMESVVFARKA